MAMRQRGVGRELRRESTTTNEASASAAEEKEREGRNGERERVLNRISGVGEEEDRRVGGRTCGDVWA